MRRRIGQRIDDLLHLGIGRQEVLQNPEHLVQSGRVGAEKRLVQLLRRQVAPEAHDDGRGPEWPPLTIAPQPDAAATTSGSSAARAWQPAVDGGCPDGYPIKVAGSGIYHVPDGLSYARTHPQRCYARAEDAEADGYRRAKL